MIENFPNWINGLFLFAAIASLIFFYLSNNKPSKFLFFLIVWSAIQCIIAYLGFYAASPPLVAIAIVPGFIMLGWGLMEKNRRWVEENRNMRISTFLHTVRIPVEICLFYLFQFGVVPELMTFEGRNFDILAGITALVVGLLLLINKLPKQVLLIWNCICLGLVVFILINGVLSTEIPIQQFGFEQPNRALLYFPFVLLPSLVVPLVIYTHITDILLLIGVKKENT